jgi:long-subunit acyl-CoA synthetase (AMP-forming)
VDDVSGVAFDEAMMRGELWLRSAAVMKGYRGDRRATESAIDADGWLHTGLITTFARIR